MTTTTLEETNEEGPAEATPQIAVFGFGLHDGAIRRLRGAGPIQLTETAAAAQFAVVSTRIPRRRSVSAVMEELRGDRPDLRVFVLTHPGGESLAVEFLRAGARAVVAEGNEGHLLQRVLEEPAQDELVDTFERRLERQGAGRRQGVAIGRSPFESRIHELAQSGTSPRIALGRVQDWDSATSRLSPESLDLLDRRLTVQFEDLCRANESELHRIGPGDYGIIGRDLSAAMADALGRNLEAVTSSFSPGRTSPLGFAIGHVGQEVTSDAGTLLELARRALELADSSDGPNVVNADELSQALASSTELDTALQAVAFLERHDPAGVSHGSRVADLVTTLAEHMGMEGRELTKVRLAAQLHDVGKVSLPENHAYGPSVEDDAATAAYRSHPELGSEALRGAGPDVATAIRHHHERWDGEGFPDGLSGEDIPVGARLISLADAIDRASQPDGSLPDALEQIEEEAGAAFDPELVRLAVQVLTR